MLACMVLPKTLQSIRRFIYLSWTQNIRLSIQSETIGIRYTLAPSRRLSPSGQAIEDDYPPNDWIAIFFEEYDIDFLILGIEFCV
jgi:hypothetical protein